MEQFLRVDPRACGVNFLPELFLGNLLGRSPRMRGKLDCNIQSLLAAGSIPAHAG